MGNITLGEIAKDLAFLSAFIGSVVYFKNMITKSIDKTFDTKLKPIEEQINNKLKPIEEQIKKLDKETSKNNLESIKTDLINLMELADKGIMSAEQKIRVHELYDYYSKHGGNSYVHDKWEKLGKEGKL